VAAQNKWQPGCASPNPSGMRKDGTRAKRKPRPPRALSRKAMMELCAAHGREMLEVLLKYARGADARMAVRAAQLVLERGYGAVPTREETTLILDDGKESGDKIEVVFVRPPKVWPDDEPRVVH
jgi:hypothetical protein